MTPVQYPCGIVLGLERNIINGLFLKFSLKMDRKVRVYRWIILI